MRSTRYPLAFALAIAVAVIKSPARAEDDNASTTISGVDLKLSVSSDHYDPLTPSSATVKCTIANNTDRALDVPSAYDGQSIKLALSARRWPWALYLMPVPPRDKTTPIGGGGGGGGSEAMKKLFSHPQAPLVHLESGQSQTIFELKLDEILNPRADKSSDNTSAPAWRWNWIAHGPAPQAPLVSEPDKFIPTASFLAVATIDNKQLESNKIKLQITPHGPASANGEISKPESKQR